MDDERDDIDAEAIQRRRRRLIALALGGAALGATACSQACLSFAADAAPFDAGVDAGPDGGAPDAEPVACLSMPAPDAGEPEEDAG